MADTQVFDPNKPYNAAPSATAEGGFDPNKPYEAAPSQLDIARANIAKYPQPGQEENHWMGKLVPQAALPAMQKFTESAPIQASEAIGQKGAQIGKELGHDVVTGADVLTHPMESLAGSLPSPYGPKPIVRSMEQTAREEHPIAYGAAGGIGEAVGGLADPRMAALAVLSGGVDEAYPVLSKIMSGAFGAQMGASTVEGARDLYTNWDKYTPEQRAEIAARTGVDAYFTKEALGHTGVPEKIVDTTRPVMNAAVRGAGHAAEGAITPAAIGFAAGSAVDTAGTKLGLPMHGAAEYGGVKAAEAIARGMGKNPYEPLGRFPRMTNFGKEPAPRELAPLPEVPKPAAPVEAPKAEAPVDKNKETLQTAYDKANTDYQKAYEAREAYRKSIDQGIQPPAAVQKAFEKAEKALDEAQFHLETYEKAPQAEAPRPKVEEAPLQPPTMVRGGQHELPGGGVMGKPLQLKGEVPTEAPEHANVADLRARMVPAKEAAGEYTERPISRNVNKVATAQQVAKTGDLIEQGLGGKPLEPNKPIYEKPQQEEAQPPVKEEATAQPVEHPRHMVNANGEALSNAIPKNAEGVELLQKLHDLSNIELRQLAINAGEDMGQLKIGRGKASGNISRPEVFERILKNHSAEDIGRMVDEGKHLPPVSGGSQGAAAEPVAINASGESAASQEAINREASDKRQGIKTYRVDSRSQNAVPLFGVDAADATAGKFEHIVRVGPNGEETIMDSGANAKPLTKPVGVERRSTERPATMSATELESAIKNRKPVTTPFDVTEGAMKTIESDKDMPQAPQQKRDANTGPAKDLESYNESIGKPKPDTTKVTKDPRAVEVADAYEAMKHDPDNPQVKKAYNALKVETKAQWEHLKDQGYTMDLPEKDPYKSYEEMVKDVKDNKHISVYDGKESHPPTDHPMSEVDPETGLTYNSLFRAVHDIMGHAAGDNDFSERGEENAYNLHRQAYSDRAIPALTTETKGQTSTFFNNKEVREGAEPGKFPEQKANLLPKEVYEKGAHEVDDAKAKEVVDHIKSGKDFAILQAENPQNNRVSDAKNAELTNKLFKELKSKGYKPVAVGGNTKDVEGTTEHAFFVPNITPEEAVKIGKAYDQQGILTNKGLHDLNTGSINPTKEGALKTGDAARGEQYYTTVGNEDFNVPLDFDKRVNLKGSPVDEFGNPTVSGGNLTKAEAEEVANKHLAEDERFGTEAGRKNFIKNLMKMPSVQEVVDIAKAGETGRKWYQRSSDAFDALTKVSPKYFLEADRDKFINFLASLSPQQSVKKNMQEALSAWSKYIDMDRPEGESLRKMLDGELTVSNSKVGNAMDAISGKEMWPDLSDNRNFKVPSFGANLRGFLDKVTNDGWQAAFAGITPEKMQTAAQYHPLSVVTRAAADALGWKPAEAQAAVWAFTKMLTEKGEKLPESIMKYSEDFADLMAHDGDIRKQLEELGVPLGELDDHLKEIERKPEPTAGASPTTENSVRKLSKRLEKLGREIPSPKDSGLFEENDAREKNAFFKPRADEAQNAEDTSFNPDELYERVTPEATDATRKMSDEELLQHGFTQDEIDAGKHLPSVAGGTEETATEDKKEPFWHSKAAKIAEEKLGGKGSGSQFLATLKNNGVKADELNVLGLEDYLKDKDKVSKQELLDHIDKNQIKLSETTKGESNDPEFEAKRKAYQESAEKVVKARDKVQEAQDKAQEIYSSEQAPFSFWSFIDSAPERQARMLDKIRPTVERTVATQPNLFAEMAERAPKGTKKIQNDVGNIPWPQEKYDSFVNAVYEHRQASRAADEEQRRHQQLQDPDRSNQNNKPKFENWTLGGPKENYKEKLIQLPTKRDETPFVRASHFGEPNVVAHTRYDDRVDADGKKNLFVEEVQSDWHQKGREEGYKGVGDPVEGYKASVSSSGRWQIKDENDKFVSYLPEHAASSPEGALKYYKDNYYQDTRVPDAPFKNDWHELVMKRMLREAAEKGYDRLSWTTGQQQADRYNLSKQVSKVSYDPETEQFTAYETNGRPVVDEKMPFEKVKDYIGNELATKLKAKVDNPSKERNLTLEHDPEQNNYKIMEDGREIDSYYNQATAQRMLSDYKNQQAGIPSIEGTDLKLGGEWANALYDRAIPNFVNKYLKKFNVKVGETKFDTDAHGKMDKVHSIDITPEMKKELKKSAPIAENENEKSPYDVA